jgi:photosystem II stability/assembly factor-like uncharacterized protein
MFCPFSHIEFDLNIGNLDQNQNRNTMKTLILLLIASLFLTKLSAQYWNPVASGTTKKLLSVSFGSEQVGYISGTDSLLLKTTDGGQTWQPVAHSGFDFLFWANAIIHVNFMSADTGYAIVGRLPGTPGNNHGELYKTTDGGANWTIQLPGNIAARSSFFFDHENGFLVGSAYFQGKTVVKQAAGNWGVEWSLGSPPHLFLNTADFRTSDIGMVAGDGGFVYRTFSGGSFLAWDTVITATDSAINALKFVSDSMIIAATDDPMGGIMVSMDTGRTWQYDMNTLTFYYPSFKSLVLSQKDSFIAVGHTQLGEGMTIRWSQQFGTFLTETTEQPMYGVAMVNDSIAVAVGDSGLILTNKIIQVGIQAPAYGKKDLKIFPNPSSGSFQTSMSADHTIKVFDLTGKLILRNDHPSKTHVLDLSENAKGVYILQAELSDMLLYEKLIIR